MKKRKKKQREKDNLRKLRAKFRKIALSGAAGTYSADDIVYVAENLQMEALQDIVTAFDPHPQDASKEVEEKEDKPKPKPDNKKKDPKKGNKKGKEPEKKEVIPPLSKEEKEIAQAAFKKALEILKEQEAEAKRKLEDLRAQEKISKRKALDDEKSKEVWTLEEMSVLAKAVAKFPAGLTRRWERITEMVNTVGNRSMKDIITKCKEFDMEQQRLGKDESFKRYQEVMTSRLAAKEESKTRQLGEEPPKAVTPKVVPKAVAPSENTIVDEGEEEPENKKGKGKGKKDKKEKAPEKAPLNPKRPFRLKLDDTVKPPAKEVSKPSPAKPAPKPVSPASPQAVVDDWTTEQQVAFEKALREVPKSDDRWDKIAERVTGKTKKDCVARFKEIRAKIMAGKK